MNFNSIKKEFEGSYSVDATGRVMLLKYYGEFAGYGGTVFCVKNPLLEKTESNQEKGDIVLFSSRGSDGFVSPSGDLYLISSTSHEIVSRDVFGEKNKDALLAKEWLALTWHHDQSLFEIQAARCRCTLSQKRYYDYCRGGLTYSSISQAQQDTLYDALSSVQYHHFFRT